MEQPVSVLANFLTYMLPANNKPFFPSSTLILIMSYNSSVCILNETSADNYSVWFQLLAGADVK